MLDPDFGNQGTVQADALKTGYAEAVAVHPTAGTAHDGKVVAAGRASPPGSSYYSFAVRRFTPAGAADTGFGSGGLATTTFGKYGSVANAIVALSDGKVLAAGLTTLNVTTTYDRAFALARYNPDGSLDATFGGRGKGKVTTDFSAREDEAYGMAVQPDGKIVLAGITTRKDGVRDLALARYTKDGALDATFDGDGKVTLAVGNDGVAAYEVAVAIQPDPVGGDKLVVAANSGGALVARFHLSGSLDTSFGSSGRVVVPIAGGGPYTGLAVQPDGKIVLCGRAANAAVPGTTTGGDVFVARLAPNGAADTSFGTRGDGTVYSDFGASERPYGLALQPDGKVVVAGYHRPFGTGHDLDFLAVRYDANGLLDPTWNWNPDSATGGVTVTDLGGDDIAHAVAVQADGKVVAAGQTYTGSADVFALARYQGDPAALTAAGGPVGGSTAAPLTEAQLRPIVAEAVRRWNLTGLTAAERSLLSSVQFHIANLDGATLGLASGNTMTIDQDAAGWGWFVDPTPGDDSEFTTPGNQGEMDRMDLLSVLMHEIGHLLGHDHDEDGLMAETLAAGTRVAPTAEHSPEEAVTVTTPASKLLPPAAGAAARSSSDLLDWASFLEVVQHARGARKK